MPCTSTPMYMYTYVISNGRSSCFPISYFLFIFTLAHSFTHWAGRPFGSGARVRLGVFDWDRSGKNDPMGKVEFGVRDITNCLHQAAAGEPMRGLREGWFPLQPMLGCPKPRGELFFRCELTFPCEGDWGRLPACQLAAACRARDLLDEGLPETLIARLHAWRSMLKRALEKFGMVRRMKKVNMVRRSWVRWNRWSVMYKLAALSDSLTSEGVLARQKIEQQKAQQRAQAAQRLAAAQASGVDAEDAEMAAEGDVWEQPRSEQVMVAQKKRLLIHRPWKMQPLLGACRAPTLAEQFELARSLLRMCRGDHEAVLVLLPACNNDASVLLNLVKNELMRGNGVADAIARTETTQWKAQMVRLKRNRGR